MQLVIHLQTEARLGFTLYCYITGNGISSMNHLDVGGSSFNKAVFILTLTSRTPLPPIDSIHSNETINLLSKALFSLLDSVLIF